MDEEKQKIIEQLKIQNPFDPVEIVIAAMDFVEAQSNDLPPPIKKKVRTRCCKLAHNYSLRPLKPALIAVFILDSLLHEHPPALALIKQQFPLDVNQMLAAYSLANQHLTHTIYNRDIYKHALSTALMLGELKLGHKTICAAMLRHVPERSEVKLEDIKQTFDQEIHDIIVSLNKIKELPLANLNTGNLKVMRQMFLAMSKELRAIIIKICAHIDLLKHLEQVPESERRKLAMEAQHLYAPIADMLGMWELKWQLEDYSFKYLNKIEYRKIEKRFNIDEKKNRDKYIQKTRLRLHKELTKIGISAHINGRLKSFYSIYQKMQSKKKAFNEIHDVFALNVVVQTVDECYRALGVVHSLWKPKPRRVKDYIAAPKANHYQSLHTTVYGFNNRMTEFQIRTKDMDEEANYGVAAHWYYKHHNQQEETPSWIRELLTAQMKAKSHKEFIENIKMTELIDRIFVYTPKNDVISLPMNSTPVDFAYQIHTEVGHKCQAAKVNGQLVPLDYRLNNQDQVEIIINNLQIKPRKAWLKFVKSNQARRAIIAALEQD